MSTINELLELAETQAEALSYTLRIVRSQVNDQTTGNNDAKAKEALEIAKDVLSNDVGFSADYAFYVRFKEIVKLLES